LDLGERSGMMSYVTVMVIPSYDTKKVIEDSETNDLIQYGKNMLAL